MRMELWQIIITGCAGVITFLTFLEKIGLTKKIRYTEEKFRSQNLALLAILRNELYKCFKENRELSAWSDAESSVQTKLHEAYKSLGGNGEEKLWWDKKATWTIVSDEEYHELTKRKNDN